MKILFLINSFTGLYNFRRELVQELLEKKYEVIISGPNHKLMNYFKTIGCTVIETSFNSRGTNIIDDIKLYLKYNRLLKSVKPNLVLTYTIKPNIYGGLACRTKKIPYICTITGLGTAIEYPGLLQKVLLFIYRFSLNKATSVFFQNKHNCEFLQERKLAINNSVLVPGSGVNLEHFKLLKYPSDNILIFLFLGRVMQEKGIEQFLEVAKYIKENYENIEFHVVGPSNEEYMRVLKDYEEKGTIKYFGSQRDIRKFIGNSHCTVHPTYYPEGMSNVLLESAASGRPVITTDRSGCREIVDDGVNGYLVEQKNTNNLIKKVESFIQMSHQKKEQMGIEGRRKVEREFNRKIVIDKYIDKINFISKG